MDQDQYRYSAEHLWVRLDDDGLATVGLSEEALQTRDEITRVHLPGEGEEFIKDEVFGRLTTARPSVFRLYAPVSGDVVEINEDVLDTPEMIIEDPYEEGWLFRIDIANLSEYDDLMTRDEYEDYLDEDLEEDLVDEEEEDLDDDLEDEDDDF